MLLFPHTLSLQSQSQYYSEIQWKEPQDINSPWGEAQSQQRTQKQGHQRNLMPLTMENIKYSQDPSQININPHAKGLLTSFPII